MESAQASGVLDLTGQTLAGLPGGLYHPWMALIALSNVTLRFRGPPVLDDASLSIEPGERLCLLGRNGSGKTTLLRILQGAVEPDRGEVIRQQGVRVATLPQEVPQDLRGPVFDLIARGLGSKAELLAEYHQLAGRLAAEETDELHAELGRIQHALENEAVGVCTRTWRRLFRGWTFRRMPRRPRFPRG